MGPAAVLHITSLPGGGVDRHVRDIIGGESRAHLVWQAAATADVIEAGTPRRFTVLEAGAREHHGSALAAWLARHGAGLVHAHSVSSAVRARVEWAMEALRIPAMVTLHDVLFLRGETFESGARSLDPQWLAQTAPFLRRAAAVLAPSQFIAQLARDHVPGLEVTVVANGSAAKPALARPLRPHPEFTARQPRYVVAVVGAIGPHKGIAMLEELAALLDGSGIAVAIVGYDNAQVSPGWRGNLFVHGAYQDADVTGLLAAYGAELALFANQVPESFSYALSEVWRAGLPAIVPPDGALGERVARHDGGWLLPPAFGAQDIAARVRWLLSPDGSAELTRVKSRLETPDAGRIPTIDAMNRSLDALYARFGIDPQAPLDTSTPAAQELLAKNLDGALFRHELTRALDELQQMKDAYEKTLAFERGQRDKADAEAREWMAKLEADIAALRAEVVREVELRRAATSEMERLRADAGAFALLPHPLQRLLKKIRNARS